MASRMTQMVCQVTLGIDLRQGSKCGKNTSVTLVSLTDLLGYRCHKTAGPKRKTMSYEH